MFTIIIYDFVFKCTVLINVNLFEEYILYITEEIRQLRFMPAYIQIVRVCGWYRYTFFFVKFGYLCNMPSYDFKLISQLSDHYVRVLRWLEFRTYFFFFDDLWRRRALGHKAWGATFRTYSGNKYRRSFLFSTWLYKKSKSQSKCRIEG